ncbi:uncharacterized protein LOC110093681 [Dendrobium catenatum]|uniref:uncharacterized protein LOC110093681 n=1 Tax=Dendrobium catenatum TaxID=906689 RepID=UPI0009F2F37D|nr:uncharacterized protein LOC110093681 [Dendrobium catenatum]
MSLPNIACWNIRGFNSPEKVFCCKNFISAHKLDMLCVLETRINPTSLLNPFFHDSHVLFPLEQDCHNFNLATPGRIWIKWNSTKACFKPEIITSQIITGTMSGSYFSPFTLSVIYAENDRIGRAALWDQIRSCASRISNPWILMGDLNCCRFASDKLGGQVLSHCNLGELNSALFDANLEDLHSVGNPFTWFNQQTTNPIHIKLDRCMINSFWSSVYPETFYSVQAPSSSDHCPLILHSRASTPSPHRFLFKNYLTSLDAYWNILLDVFSLDQAGSPLADLCYKLRVLKGRIKSESWSNAKAIQEYLDSLHRHQSHCLQQIAHNPSNVVLNHRLKEISSRITNFTSLNASWIIQRAKSSWLSHGEDDLKFLYDKIRRRKASSNAAINLSSSSYGVREDSITAILNHYQDLFNPPLIENLNINLFPSGYVLQPHIADELIIPISDDEIRKVVFDGARLILPRVLMAIIFTSSKDAGTSLAPRLHQKGFHEQFILWIKQCITNVNFSIVIKGALEGYIPSTAGLRQGCPLSPFLFCIAMDALSSILDDNIFKGVHYKEFNISHLLYADDLLILGEATPNNCANLMRILNTFSEASGLHINMDKSSLLLPKHIPNGPNICNSLNLTQKESISYLGIPISFKKLKLFDIAPLTDKIMGKFSGWNAKLLSMAGRLQYLKFTMLNSIAYWIRGAIIPKAVFKIFRKLASKFLLFGDASVGKKLHMISWDNICKPKYTCAIVPSMVAFVQKQTHAP